ncbi:YbfB/YjiJ family MFS transporter [Rivibacter subsaxonicus]|uniref:Putative MFS-type transporter YbfB n=1 Tax=Rivibacter subsaxonicus TaxID=457575 RepID=A0A4Q7VZI8_9BURK|nr:YbfB/YjiJ family MFS transporter [Rivibacter subsaxonicus]RZU02190.1 putative MFS-type transporter YbfB [Rivibacter subsaxonicus]
MAALALGLAAAVSLGLARFSYALLLPPMRADLGWSYLTAGAMNTVNAAGYLVGALLMPRVLVHVDARHAMLAGGFAVAALLVAHGLVAGDAALYALRAATGVASAASFVGGGLLAARLATTAAGRGGLVLGLYYGGTGIGIVAAALAVPPLVALARPHAWQVAWWLLGALALVATLVTVRGTRGLDGAPVAAAARGHAPLAPLAFGLAAYLMFGLGYIGYMTFVVTLLREQGLGDAQVVAFYALLGLGVMASSWLWAGLLQRRRDGRPMSLLNALLALATALPVVSTHPVAVFASGALFGSVFLSVVASTTALVRHNLPPAAWPGGIAAFTIVFAAGQIVGPSLVGWVADGPGGLARGFICSAAVLAFGALLASRQRALAEAVR